MAALVLVTSGGCGHCTEYKKIWPGIRSGIQGVTVYHIDLPAGKGSYGSQYPEGLKKYIEYYPTFILVNDKEYKQKKITSAVVMDENVSTSNAASINRWVAANQHRVARHQGAVAQHREAVAEVPVYRYSSFSRQASPPGPRVASPRRRVSPPRVTTRRVSPPRVTTRRVSPRGSLYGRY